MSDCFLCSCDLAIAFCAAAVNQILWCADIARCGRRAQGGRGTVRRGSEKQRDGLLHTRDCRCFEAPRKKQIESRLVGCRSHLEHVRSIPISTSSSRRRHTCFAIATGAWSSAPTHVRSLDDQNVAPAPCMASPAASSHPRVEYRTRISVSSQMRARYTDQFHEIAWLPENRLHAGYACAGIGPAERLKRWAVVEGRCCDWLCRMVLPAHGLAEQCAFAPSICISNGFA